MQKYRERSRTIEAVRFFPDARPWPKGVKLSLGEPTLWIGIYGYTISAGDWLLYDGGRPYYMMKDESFRRMYEPVEG